MSEISHSHYRGHRFPAKVISQAVRLCLRFPLEQKIRLCLVFSWTNKRRWTSDFGDGFNSWDVLWIAHLPQLRHPAAHEDPNQAVPR